MELLSTSVRLDLLRREPVSDEDDGAAVAATAVPADAVMTDAVSADSPEAGAPADAYSKRNGSTPKRSKRTVGHDESTGNDGGDACNGATATAADVNAASNDADVNNSGNANLNNVIKSEDGSFPDRDMVILWCMRNGLQHVEVSALDGDGILDAIQKLANFAHLLNIHRGLS